MGRVGGNNLITSHYFTELQPGMTIGDTAIFLKHC